MPGADSIRSGWAAGSSSNLSSHSTREKPWLCFPRDSASEKCAKSRCASSSAKPSARSRASASSASTPSLACGESRTEEPGDGPDHRRHAAPRIRVRLRLELEDRPTALARDAPELAVGVGHHGMPDRELRRIAGERGWPILEFEAQAYPYARRRVPPVIWAVTGLFGAGLAASKRRRGG